MTDWSEYQLDEFVWDEFKESGDHIVPHPGNEQINHGTSRDDSCKKRLKSVRNSSDSDIGARDTENKEMSCATVNEARGQMLENHSWSCMLNDSCQTDSTKEMASLGDGNCINGNNNGAKLGNNGASASVNGSLSQFTLDISAANTDMELFGNDHEEKDNAFLSYYGWPDIGNFEDVDNMFRTCDSTFGQGDITTAGDDFSWFPPSSKAIDGSEDALKSGFKSPCSDLSKVKHEEAEFKFMPVTATQVANETDQITAPNDYAVGLQPMDGSDYANLGFSYCNMVDTNVESSVPMEQVNFQEKQLQNHNQIEGKRVDSSSEHLSSGSFQSSRTTEQFSNQVERPSNPSLNASSMMLEEKSHSHQQTLPTSDAHLAVTKQLQNIQDRVGNCSDPDSSCVLEGSSNNSMSTDESSLEATSFRQLNYVMEQLDLRTKLCIRDSLYRLARSAEQRNNFENSNNCFVDGGDRNDAQMTGDTNKSFIFMDIETDTNPIDRSIAHLLFHRPKDPAEGAKFTEFRSIGSTQPMVPGKLVSQEEVPRVMDTKLVYKDRF
ncbi:protein LNK1-like isoform X2 [Papaver somniferum]|uniref:protein LNK1-like isoform X2 n=1 Tax=Papaver somniferum TaxID=3469 RepID=UPI000E6F817F|nr:protein LNK1-like isoform X2 [Papaver somniferum]